MLVVTVPNLLIVGAPRSMTTAIAAAAARMLGRENLGEVFNRSHYQQQCPPGFLGRLLPKQDASDAGYRRIARYLLFKIRPGKVVKDVEQPRHIARFLTECPQKVNAFYLHRDAAEVRACIARQRWEAPDPTVYEALYAGLPRLEYAAAIEDWRPLFDLLQRFGYAPREHNYLTPDFLAYRAEVRARFA